FFQAEDGIRDATVTGVQTCALPICPRVLDLLRCPRRPCQEGEATGSRSGAGRDSRGPQEGSDRLRGRGPCEERRPSNQGTGRRRSEERRVGKERKSRGTRWSEQKTN